MQASGRAQRGSNADLYDVEDPGPNDVLFGRGTGSNMHSGNIRFRALIQKYKPVYRDTPKKMKPSVSTKVVAIWRSQTPPGRFLTRSDRFHGSKRTFYDVGDAMARRKAAQCLREKSSKERMEQQQEKAGEKRPLEETNQEANTDSSSNSEELVEAIPSSGGEVAALGEVPSSSALPMDTDDKQVPDLPPEETEEDIDVLAMVTSANLDEKFGPAATQTNEPPKEEQPKSDSQNSNKLIPSTLKKLLQSATADAKKLDDTAWLACGSPKSDSMSLVNTYDNTLKEDDPSDDRDGTSDSPFLFASFDFESRLNSSSNDKNEGGLCFPSLFGGTDSGKSSPALFGDDHSTGGLESSSAFPSLFGGGSSSAAFPFEEEATTTTTTTSEPEPTPALPVTIPLPSTKQDTLQTIRDRMPTAASLTTTSLFDW